MHNQPMVSVCIQTYNHAAFITQCVESVLAQQTGFPVEIIIGEDDSTDGTRDICMALQHKYPGKINLFLRDKKDKISIDGMQTGRFNFMENIRAANGKYIALLDGDDYWCDTGKLQKQVALMEANPAMVLACGKAKHLLPGGGIVDVEQRDDPQQTVFDIRDALLTNFYHMGTLFFRNQKPFSFPPFITASFFGDLSMVWWLAKDGGSIGFIEDCLLVYRVHEEGLSKRLNPKKYYDNYYFTQDRFNELTAGRYAAIISDERFIRDLQLTNWMKPYAERLKYFSANFARFIKYRRKISHKLNYTVRYLLPVNGLLKKLKETRHTTHLLSLICA